MATLATLFSPVLLVLMLLCLLEGFGVSMASAASVGSSPHLPDLNGNDVVDLNDLVIFARAYGSSPGDPNWNSSADFYNDGKVDLQDLILMAQDFGKGCRVYDFDDLSAWNVSSGGWSVQNGTLEGFSTSDGLIYAGNATWTDCTFTAEVKFAGDSVTSEAALAFCVSDPNNFYYAGLGCFGHRVSISRHVSNVWQELAFSGDTAEVERDVWYVLSVEVSGGSISMYLDGSLQLSVEDSTLVLGSVGIRIWDSHVIVDYVTAVGFPASQGQPAHHVLYADGIVLRAPTGVGVHLIGTIADYNVLSRDIWFSYDDVQKMKSYGSNALELGDLWFKDMVPHRVIDQSWINRLDTWVSWCTQAQMYCIINFENFEYKSWGGDAPVWLIDKYATPWTEDVWNRASIDFWDVDNPLQEDSRQAVLAGFQFLANRYKNDKYVLFGLFDEPFAGNNLVNYKNAEHLSITYARFVERIVDAIRSAGAEQLIIVNKPYVWYYTNHFEPVNRNGIVWDDHAYVSTGLNISDWEAMFSRYVQTYVYAFKKPFIVGGYGVYPFSEYNSTLSDWRTTLQKQVTFLKSLPICGYLWFEYPWLEGQYYDYVYNYLTKEDSDYILQTIYG